MTNAELVTKMRALAVGRVEWRVQCPVDRCYCMTFSRSDSSNPEREAREWLATHQQRFPASRHAKYEVAEVRVFDELEELALKAADAIRSLEGNAKETT